MDFGGGERYIGIDTSRIRLFYSDIHAAENIQGGVTRVGAVHHGLVVHVARMYQVQVSQDLLAGFQIVRIIDSYLVEIELSERHRIFGGFVPRIFVYPVFQEGFSGGGQCVSGEEVVVLGQAVISVFSEVGR